MVLSNKDILFHGIEDRKETMKALTRTVTAYEKDEVIINKDDEVTSFALIEEGTVSILRSDLDGNELLVQLAHRGDIFADAFSFAGAPSPVLAIAREDTRIRWLSVRKAEKDGRILVNMLRIASQRNVFLTKRIEILAKRRLEEKVLTFLEWEAERHGRNDFDIEFDRAEMASFLGADRSALSLVLSKLRDRGLIDYRKNHFTYIEKEKD